MHKGVRFSKARERKSADLSLYDKNSSFLPNSRRYFRTYLVHTDGAFNSFFLGNYFLRLPHDVAIFAGASWKSSPLVSGPVIAGRIVYICIGLLQLFLPVLRISSEMMAPERTILDFIHRGPWWKNRGELTIHPLSVSSRLGLDGLPPTLKAFWS